jgi:hypothetical protein
MPKRKHTKKHQITPCSDTNQHARESLREKARIAEAKQKKFEELRQMYLEEAKRREEESKNKKMPQIISPTITPAVERDVANE